MFFQLGKPMMIFEKFHNKKGLRKFCVRNFAREKETGKNKDLRFTQQCPKRLLLTC